MFFYLRQTMASVVVLLGLSAGAVADSRDDLALLMRYLSPIATVSGDFRQQTLDARQQNLQVLSGRFILMREGPTLLWVTTSPENQILRVQNDELWTLELDLEQLLIQDLGLQLEQSPALLLTGSETEIAQQYEVHLLEQSDTDSSFALIPRDPSSPLERIEIQFVQNQPERLRLLDSFQQTTLVVFQNLIINEAISESSFEFDVPAHFDVIDQRAQ